MKTLTKKIVFCLSLQLIVSNYHITHIHAKKSQTTNHHLIPRHTFDKNLLSVFRETGETKVYDATTYTSDISYLFADLKYKDGKIKICEFGEGKNAAAAMSSVVYGKKTHNIITPYWILFWHYLTQFKLPVWYVGLNPNTHLKKSHVVPLNKKVYWNAFIAMGGHYAPNLLSLEQDHVFQWCEKQNITRIPENISTYKGIIIYRYRDDRNEERLQEFELFKKNHPDFLLLDEVSKPYAANKYVLADLCSDKELSAYKPKWGIYPKKYSPELVKKIKKDLGCNIFVIKPINSGRSNGIIMVEEQDLDSTLQYILHDYTLTNSTPRFINYRPSHTKTYGYWKKDKNSTFMVEEYQPSRHIKINKKWYDPTMRVVFVLHYDQRKIYTTILGAYWKIPPAPLFSHASLTKKHKTVSVHTPGYTGLRIDPTDLQQLKATLQQALPKIYLKMLQAHQKDKKILDNLFLT